MFTAGQGTSSVLLDSVSVAPQGIAGNLRCEVGESFATTPQDCPYSIAAITCPTPATSIGSTLHMCGGNGDCNQGVCQCRTGYAGAACDQCAAGYLASGTFCVKDPNFTGSSAATADGTSGSAPASESSAAAGGSSGGAAAAAPPAGSGSGSGSGT